MISSKEIKERLLPLVREVAKDYLPSELELKDNDIFEDMLEKGYSLIDETDKYVVGIEKDKLVVFDTEEEIKELVSLKDLTDYDLSNLLTHILMQ